MSDRAAGNAEILREQPLFQRYVRSGRAFDDDTAKAAGWDDVKIKLWKEAVEYERGQTGNMTPEKAMANALREKGLGSKTYQSGSDTIVEVME